MTLTAFEAARRPDSVVLTKHLVEMLQKHVTHMNPQTRYLMEQHLLEGRTLQALGTELGIPWERANVLLAHEQGRLRMLFRCSVGGWESPEGRGSFVAALAAVL